LRDDVEKARLDYEACMRMFLHRIDELPSLPRSDGTRLVQIAAQDHKKSIDTYATAQAKLAAFLNSKKGSEG